MDIFTGQGAEEGGERGGAKAAVKVGDEAGLGKAAEGEEYQECETLITRIEVRIMRD